MRGANSVKGRPMVSSPASAPPASALRVLVAAPRGFCAGVERAIQIVELALEKHGAPVYVRHEIVHNRFVVDSLKAKGAVFVKELDEVPDGAQVIFSAHGVPKSIPATAQERGLDWLDATCPLVSKVHRQAERLVEQGRHILLVGHAGHPEVIGTRIKRNSHVCYLPTLRTVGLLSLNGFENIETAYTGFPVG